MCYGGPHKRKLTEMEISQPIEKVRFSVSFWRSKVYTAQNSNNPSKISYLISQIHPSSKEGCLLTETPVYRKYFTSRSAKRHPRSQTSSEAPFQPVLLRL